MAMRFDLVYGRSGSGKTSWGLKLAEAHWKNGRKKTRWYLGDGGRETIEASGMIDDGVIEVVQYNLWPFPFQTTMRACQGWWPANPAQPGSPWQPPAPTDAEVYAMRVYEGLTVMSDYLMGDIQGGLRERMSKGDKIKEAGIQFRDGEMSFGTNSAANFGTAQEQMLTRIEESRAFSGWVLWTAHETLAEDKKKLGPREGTGPIISAGVEYGPDVCGQALTPTIGASFGNTIHLHPAIKLTRDPKEVDPDTKKPVEHVEVIYRAYTRRHFDPHMNSTVKYFANSRLPPEYASLMPEWLEPDPLKFYAILAEAKQKARAARSAAQGVK